MNATEPTEPPRTFAEKALAIQTENLQALSITVEKAIEDLDAITGRGTLPAGTEKALAAIRLALLNALPYVRADMRRRA